MEPSIKMNDGKIYHSALSISAEDSSSSRRGSRAGTAFRRASAVLGRLFIPQSFPTAQDLETSPQFEPTYYRTECAYGMSKLLSGLYCKSLVILGLVLPITQVLVKDSSAVIYQVFYMYLSCVGLLFMAWMYSCLVRNRAVVNIINSYRKDENDGIVQYRSRGPLNRYGSFYLRLGAIGFGVGSMVYSGLEFGQVLELKDSSECRLWPAITSPLFRMAFTIGQMQFIFLNSQSVDMCTCSVVSRFGLMHMIATNLCEWLNVIIQETKHEIAHFNSTRTTFNSSASESDWSSECRHTNVMGSLVADSAPVLYPCTIEYSLICAVIMYQMWQDVGRLDPSSRRLPAITVQRAASSERETSSEVLILDCANAHKGLITGIGLLILTGASLTVYLISSGEHQSQGREAVDMWELILHALSTVALLLAVIKLWDTTGTVKRKDGMCLDTWLLVVAQSGVSTYSITKIVGYWLSNRGNLTNEFARLLQSTLQTVFIVHYWRVRTRKLDKPARQLITFLLLCNAAFWSINTLVRNRISSDEELVAFYGPWGWTVMSRISMPLNIFYRFHSTICLFEIWKNVYKQSVPVMTVLELPQTVVTS